jgi:poly(A) polymerase
MQISPEQIDPEAAKVVQRLRRYDHTAYLVGGCVRDLLLGGKPKDFDVATSAAPNEIRRLFRNCRIIGRRFRLAHIFFGSKIIETATFRANPRDTEEEAGEGSAPESDGQDLLIRRDNVFGTAEEDARRRDFTINGLFYDIETNQVIDHVQGMADLEARLVRTIGDPDVRFREDPVRILRAVKFAARCNLNIETETYRRMLEHAGELQKCAQARVSEEFYRLLRAGAAKRSVELLLETTLLRQLVPALSGALAADDSQGDTRLVKARLWAYLAALDRSTARRDSPPSNALVLATLLYPQLRDALHPDTRSIRDIGQFISTTIGPIIEQIKASRRDSDLARRILLAMRWIFPSSNSSRRRPRFAGREFLDDALRLHEIVSDAEALEPDIAGRPLLAEGETPTLSPEAEEKLARELEAPSEFERRRDNGGGGGGGGGSAREPGAPRERATPAHHASASGGAQLPGGPAGVRTPIPDLGKLGPRAASKLPFLGTGAFGGRWNVGET